MSTMQVRAWSESVSIPTYGVGAPDRNPMFLEKRVYQGSSGAVYPLPVIDRIEDRAEDRAWEAVFLENAYLKIMILPALGGRVQMALDKTNDYHFVYYNRVIKPALVGLAGPWISGGIEFNWPQHHRPGTFMPVVYAIEEHPDGAKTVWCSEIDRMHRTKGMHGFRLHPDRAYLEIEVKLYNRTDLPQTFLWWANPAVHVDEHHQSIFPPDVHAVMDHGKRDVSSFPIATGEYYKVDYSPGTDISRYSNIPVPTSYMAYKSNYDFVGSYDHRRRAGLLHVANRHISPGKKQWTWGNGDFGQRWDRHLTDADGPYIELMCGVYTDNQPDFSWLAAGEEKAFTQIFMPYKGVGRIGNATRDAVVGLEPAGKQVTVRAYVSAPQPGARIELRCGTTTVLDESADLDPAMFFERTVALAGADDDAPLEAVVYSSAGQPLVRYRPDTATAEEIPAPAQAIGRPRELDSVESLYLAGMHLEQYRHATREPADYYREGLRRDPGDVRCNNALGLLLLRRGRFAEAEKLLRRSVERMTRHNPNPGDGEPLYNLGLALAYQARHAEAEEAFWKATWNAAWQESAFFALARLACRRGAWDAAQDLIERSLRRNVDHHRATHLRVYLLRRRGETALAESVANEELARDRFNMGVHFEQALASGDWNLLDERMRDAAGNYLELALDYAAAGLYDRATAVLEHYLARTDEQPETPMVEYCLAHFARCRGRKKDAVEYTRKARSRSPQYCFPNRLEEIEILEAARRADPADPRAPYYLGNLWYDKRQHAEAIACWEAARDLDPQFPTVWRNLGLAYFNHRGDASAAWKAYQTAFDLDSADARVLFELDQLAKRLNHDPQQRLTRLDAHLDRVRQRDDLYLERVTLLNQLNRHADARAALLEHNFHPWEGGEGKVPAQFVLAVTELARAALDAHRFDEALALLGETDVWPECLGEGKLAGIQENNINYLRGCALAGQGDDAAAARVFAQAAEGLSEPTSAVFYNDQPPDMIFYQGLAQRALGNQEAARLRFCKLIEYGETHLNDEVEIDYFAVSLPDFLVFEDDLQRRNEIHCRYMIALGRLGLGEGPAAAEAFARILALDCNHVGALVHQSLVDTRLGQPV